MPASSSADPAAERPSDGPGVPLRPDQWRMWLLEQLDPTVGLFGLGFALRFRGPIDHGRAGRALADVLARHPILSTAIEIVDDQPVQIAGAAEPPSLEIERVDDGTDDDIRARADRFLSEPYDLHRGPLARFLLLDRGPDGVVLVVGVHHLIGDLWSLSVLGAELADAYRRSAEVDAVPEAEEAEVGAADRPPRRPARQRSFADFVEAERALIGSDPGRRSLRFWRDHLPDRWPVIDLAPLAPPPEGTGPSGRRLRRIPAEEVARWRAAADHNGVTLHDLVLTGLYALVHRYTGQSEPVVGTYRANRSPRDLATIGCFRNLLAWSVPVEPDDAFATLLRRVGDAVARSRPHQRISLPAVVGEFRDSGWVDDVVLPVAYQWVKTTRRVAPDLVTSFSGAGRRGADADQRGVVDGLEIEPFDLDHPIDTDLSLEVHQHDDGLDLVLLHRRDRLEATVVERMADHLVRLLRSGIEAPDTTVGRLAMRSAAEEAAAPATARPPGTPTGDTAVAGPGAARTAVARTVVDLIGARLAATPDEVVIRDGGRRLTARQLGCEADALALRLRRAGIGHGDRVGVHLRPSLEVPAVLLAVLRLGATYVPLDPDTPDSRIRMLAEDGGVRLVVTADVEPPRWEPEDGSEAPVWLRLDGPDDPATTTTPARATTTLDDGRPSPLGRSSRPCRRSPDDLVYISFTSGSTGRPKPVGVTNANAVNYLRAMQERPGFGPGDVILAMASLTFDISFSEFVLPLVAGGSAVVARPESVAEPAELVDLVRTAGVTVIQTTPTIWRRLLDHGLTDAPGLRAWCGGEDLSPDLAARLDGACREAWNLYGPTETTVWCSAWRVVPGRPTALGDPFPGVDFHVLGTGGDPQPVGATGELHIGGIGVTPGYVGRPEQTAAAFVPDPWRGGEARLYRTGDLVVRGEDGGLHYLGRADHQIKLHGQRIEPGEIESVLMARLGVRAAAVVARQDQLVAFVETDGPFDAVAARRQLTEHLPVSMIPALIEPIDRMPLTTSRKIDRGALRDRPVEPRPAPDEAPRPGIEQRLASLVARAVGVDEVGRHDDFFDLGGDSLAAAALFADIRELTGQDVPLAALFHGPTVAQLAPIVSEGWRPSSTSLVEVQPQGTRRPFFSVSPFLISTLSYRLLADCLGPDQPLYALQPQGLESDDPIHDRIEDMAAHYVAEMRRVQPVGPYRIGGHCAGSWVAFEMARQLEGVGERVELLVLVDAAPPNFDHLRPGGLRHLVHSLDHYRRTGRLWPALAWQFGLVRQRVAGRVGGDPAQRRIAEVRATHRRAHEAYRAGGRVGGPAVLFRSVESADRRDCDWHLHWRELIETPLEVGVVPGTHADLMLEASNTRALAGQLAALFDQLDRGLEPKLGPGPETTPRDVGLWWRRDRSGPLQA